MRGFDPRGSGIFVLGSNYDICGVNDGIRDHSLWPDPLNMCVAVVMPILLYI